MNTDVAPSTQGSYEMHNVEAVLMGTMALMSGYTQCGYENKHLMAHKIVANLSFLINHPELTSQFRAALGNLRTLWKNSVHSDMQAQPLATQERETQLWHTAPDAVH
jgi:hypothetical protein